MTKKVDAEILSADFLKNIKINNPTGASMALDI